VRLRRAASALGAVATLGVAAVAFAVPAGASAPDRCTGLPSHGASPVVDAANVVPADAETALAADLTAYHDAGNEAIVAATVSDLGGDDVASYAKRLFECWGVGDKGSDNGVLVLVAMAEHRTRIELGAGLADRVPDERLSIAVEAMTGPLRQGDVAGGLRAAAVAVADDLGTPLAGAGTAGDDTTSGGAPGVVFPVTGDRDDGFTSYSPGGSGLGLAAAIPLLILVAIGVAVGKAVAGAAGRGGNAMARGGFPWSRGYSYWDTPTMYHGGRWDDAGSMSSGSSGGGSFGGGSSGGGGASGSW